ncbi:MAG: hypothetical protein ABFD12_03705 [Syntrophorhabdus sp.]
MGKKYLDGYDLTAKPFLKALLEKAPESARRVKEKYGISIDIDQLQGIDAMIESAIILDILDLIFQPLTDVTRSEPKSSFPKDRILAFVCSIWFFTTAIPRIETEGHTIDINNLSNRIGPFFFSDYGEDNVAGLVKIGIQYWKELGTMAPPSVVEWHKAFAQMIFIHYEMLVNKSIDLSGLDLDMTIGKMIKVFLSMSLTLPQDTTLN